VIEQAWEREQYQLQLEHYRTLQLLLLIGQARDLLAELAREQEAWTLASELRAHGYWGQG
jgi:hypothetical protein